MTSVNSHLPTAPNFNSLRLGKKTIEALEVMAWQGLPLHRAAEMVGMRRGNLERAFNLPQVRMRWNQLAQYIRQNEGQAAVARIAELARSAKSEHVRLAANEWLAGVQGVAPISRGTAPINTPIILAASNTKNPKGTNKSLKGRYIPMKTRPRPLIRRHKPLTGGPSRSSLRATSRKKYY